MRVPPPRLLEPQPLPWFLRPHESGANMVEVAYASSFAQTGGGATTYVCTDVPKAEFDAMLARAAKHEGYKGRQRDVREFKVRDVALAIQQHERGAVGVERRSVCEVRKMDGTALVTRLYRREALPFSAFPCDAELHDVRRVRRLELRVHARARLVFEASKSELSATGEVVRGVRLEIDVGARTAAHQHNNNAEDWEDLRRTTENTIQNVLLGLRPRKPNSIGRMIDCMTATAIGGESARPRSSPARR